MWMDRIAVQWGLDRRMFWAEIRAKTGWNDMWMHPTIALKDPLSWATWSILWLNYLARFHYFEELIPREMLSEEYGFSDDAEEMCWDISSNVQLNQQAHAMKRQDTTT